MKIGLVIDDSLDRTDGVQQYVLTLGEWLSSQGHEVHYVCGETKRGDLPNLHSLTRNIKLAFNQNRLSIPGWARRTDVTQLLQEPFDVLHVQMPFSPTMSGRVIRQAPSETAIVGTFHVYPAGRLAAWGTQLLATISRHSLDRFASIMSVSRPAQKFMKQSWGLSSQIVPNPVNLRQAAEEKTRSSSKDIVFLGRLVERKGAAYLLKAYAALPERENYQLIIGGSGPLEASLRQLAEQLGIIQQTRFRGFVPESEKFGLLASAQVAVFPSTGGESFGISLTEAMAAGTVVLAGDNPGYASVLQGSPDSLVKPLDTPAFSQKLQIALGDKQFRQRLYSEQQALVKQFDIKKVGPQVLAVYESALQRKQKVT